MTHPASQKITVGIPFFNAERTLADAVRSVFAQTEHNWVLLLVDDGSTDGSLRIARGIRDPRVKVVSDGERRGLVTRLNDIAARADTPLLARMDSDDLMHPERLARQAAALAAAPEVDVVGSAAFVIDGNRRVIGDWTTAPVPRTVAEVLERGLLFIHPSVMYRTAFAKALRYEREYEYAEDLAFWCRAVETASCSLVDEPLLFYRVGIPVALGRYRANKRTVRAVLRRFGGALPVRRRAALHLKTYWSVAAYRAARLLGVEDRLVRRRARRLSRETLARAEAALHQIDSTPVPGWD
jgi:glycosyltransferase involved in cell wall biosynthesis